MRIFSWFVFALILIAPAAQAALVSYDFTASITRLADYDARGNSTNVAQGTVYGYTIASTQTITGSLRYDTQAPVSAMSESGRYMFYLSAAQSPAISYALSNGPSFDTESALSVQVADDALAMAGADVFYAHGFVEFDSKSAMGVSVVLADYTATALTSAAMPGSLEIERFSVRDFRTTWGRSDGSFLLAEGVLTSWVQVAGAPAPAPVPEPGSLPLAGAGLCLALRLSHSPNGRRRRI